MWPTVCSAPTKLVVRPGASHRSSLGAVGAVQPRSVAVTAASNRWQQLPAAARIEQQLIVGATIRLQRPTTIGNQRADNAATSGLKQFPTCTTELSNWFAARHDAYKKLARRIHTLIIAMMHASSDKRLEQQKQINPFATTTPTAPRVTIPNKLTYGDHRQARVMCLRPIPTGIHQPAKHNKNLKQHTRHDQPLPLGPLRQRHTRVNVVRNADFARDARQLPRDTRQNACQTQKSVSSKFNQATRRSLQAASPVHE